MLKPFYLAVHSRLRRVSLVRPCFLENSPGLSMLNLTFYDSMGPIKGQQPNSQAWVDGFDHQGP